MRILCLLLMAMTIQISFAQAPFTQNLKGKYAVGFQTFYEFDAARPAVKEQTEKSKGRVMQINVWYPATKSKKAKLNFKDYVGLHSQEINSNSINLQTSLNDFFDWTLKAGAPKDLVEKFKQNGVQTWAVKDAKIAKGNFPVVLLMHGKVADFVFAGELLASQGFIAIHTPYKGFSQADLDVNVLGMETQIEDYEFAVSAVKNKIKADYENLGIVAVSFGGQSAVSYTFKHPKTKAIVSLDGGIGSKFGAYLVTQGKLYKLENIKTPLLHLYNPRDQYTDVKAILGYKYSNRTLIAMKNMEHTHFYSHGILDKFIPNLLGNIRPNDCYEAVLQNSVVFLKKHLNNQNSEIAAWAKACEDSSQKLEKIT